MLLFMRLNRERNLENLRHSTERWRNGQRRRDGGCGQGRRRILRVRGTIKQELLTWETRNENDTRFSCPKDPFRSVIGIVMFHEETVWHQYYNYPVGPAKMPGNFILKEGPEV